jgi:hypothetical protein
MELITDKHRRKTPEIKQAMQTDIKKTEHNGREQKYSA